MLSTMKRKMGLVACMLMLVLALTTVFAQTLLSKAEEPQYMTVKAISVAGPGNFSIEWDGFDSKRNNVNIHTMPNVGEKIIINGTQIKDIPNATVHCQGYTYLIGGLEEFTLPVGSTMRLLTGLAGITSSDGEDHWAGTPSPGGGVNNENFAETGITLQTTLNYTLLDGRVWALDGNIGEATTLKSYTMVTMLEADELYPARKQFSILFAHKFDTADTTSVQNKNDQKYASLLDYIKFGGVSIRRINEANELVDKWDNPIDAIIVDTSGVSVRFTIHPDATLDGTGTSAYVMASRTAVAVEAALVTPFGMTLRAATTQYFVDGANWWAESLSPEIVRKGDMPAVTGVSGTSAWEVIIEFGKAGTDANVFVDPVQVHYLDTPTRLNGAIQSAGLRSKVQIDKQMTSGAYMNYMNKISVDGMTFFDFIVMNNFEVGGHIGTGESGNQKITLGFQHAGFDKNAAHTVVFAKGLITESGYEFMKKLTVLYTPSGNNDDTGTWSYYEGEITTISLGNLTQTYGSVTAVTATSDDEITTGNIVIKYKAEGAEDTAYSIDLPVNAGRYDVLAEIEGDITQGKATGTLIINKKTVTFSDVTDTFDYAKNTQFTVAYTLSITGLNVTGNIIKTEVGTFAYTLTVDDANHTGKHSGNLTINKVFSGISATVANGYTLTVGDSLDITKFTVEKQYNDDSKEIVSVTADQITGYDAQTAGEQTLTVTVDGKTATIKIIVNAASDSGEKGCSGMSVFNGGGGSVLLAIGALMLLFLCKKRSTHKN